MANANMKSKCKIINSVKNKFHDRKAEDSEDNTDEVAVTKKEDNNQTDVLLVNKPELTAATTGKFPGTSFFGAEVRTSLCVILISLPTENDSEASEGRGVSER